MFSRGVSTEVICDGERSERGTAKARVARRAWARRDSTALVPSVGSKVVTGTEFYAPVTNCASSCCRGTV